MALDKAISQVRKAALDQRTALKRAAYQFSPSKKLSRLYAFRLVGPDDHPEIVPEEAAVVREVIAAFAEGQFASQVKARLDARKIKNRSGKAWSESELKALVRPIYASLVKAPLGTYRRSTVYPALVSRKMWAQATKNLSEGLERGVLGLLSDTRNDEEELAAVEECQLAALERF